MFNFASPLRYFTFLDSISCVIVFIFEILMMFASTTSRTHKKKRCSALTCISPV